MPGIPACAPEHLRQATGKMIEGKGEILPVSVFDFAADGTWPCGTTQYEKRAIAVHVPIWDSSICIQCGKCAMVCPHAAIRTKVAKDVTGAPAGFKAVDYKGKEFAGHKFMVQVAPQDCTGCTLCAEVCPAKAKDNPEHKALHMEEIAPHMEREVANFDYFLTLPELEPTAVALNSVKNVQLLQPLFEFSGACAGCGETPYIKLASQLFGERMVIANATGCSSIYGGNLPTTPYTKNAAGRGPAWSNSLFEDNAEFGLGMRCALDAQRNNAHELLKDLEGKIGGQLANQLISAVQKTPADFAAQRARVEELRKKLAGIQSDQARHLELLADALVERSVWLFGGDGWAYDIGYGGLDHVLHSGRNVNILVLDTGVYSNTGGQQSKATPTGASAKFAAAGKCLAKKDLGAIAMVSENVYVASVSLGANDAQVLKAFTEAESYDGPSLILAYSHCIAHGFDMNKGLAHQKMAVETGLWPLYRFDPRLKGEGKNPMQLDSKAPTRPFAEIADNETRFKVVKKQDPARYEMLVAAEQEEINERRKYYERIASAIL
jgi:pyruvate-ferredoxin/flavodoxin oxidoreductase